MPTITDIVSLIPTSKPDEARRFYTETLGITLDHEDGFGMSFSVAGRRFRLTKLPEPFTPHPFSILAYSVDNADVAVSSLAARGVTFERYDSLEQDARGIWQVPGGGPRIAWFKDPDGNLLSVVGS